MCPLTCSCFLLLPLKRFSLLALPQLLRTCLPSPWSPPSPLHASALIPSSLAKVLLTLTLYPLMIWCSGQTALFLFLLAKAALAYLPTALSVALRPLFPFQQAQYAQVFLLKPAPFCKLFVGLGSTNKSATSLHFSSYLTLIRFSPPCPLLHLSFYLNLSGRSDRNCLLSSPVPRRSFLLKNNAADELARWVALFIPSTIPCGLCCHLLYPLFSFIRLAACCLI